MGRRQHRTISAILKQTSKLYKPRMTSVLEGKVRMQGPLDESDAEIDFTALQVCGNCRNNLDSTQTQNCSICNGIYHSFCLEIPLNAGVCSTPCCYKCQHIAAADKFQQTSIEVAANEVVQDEQAQERKSLCWTNEDAPVLKAPVTLYTVKERSAAWDDMKANETEGPDTSSSKTSADPTAKSSKTVCKRPTYPVQMSGVRRQNIRGNLEHSDSPPKVEISDLKAKGKSVKGIGVGALQSLFVSNKSIEAGNTIETVAEVFTDPVLAENVMSDKNMGGLLALKECGRISDFNGTIHAEIQEESKNDQMIEISIVGEEKAWEIAESKPGPVANEIVPGDDPSLSTLRQSVMEGRLLPGDCSSVQTREEDTNFNMQKAAISERCTLEELDGLKTQDCIAGETSLPMVLKEEPLADQCNAFFNNEMVVAKLPSEEASRRHAFEMNMAENETMVKVGAALTQRTFSPDQIGIVTQLGTHMHVSSNESVTALLTEHKMGEGSYVLQAQASLDAACVQASDAYPVFSQQTFGGAQNEVHHAQLPTPFLRQELAKTGCSPTSKTIAHLQTETRCNSANSDHLQNMQKTPYQCVHQALTTDLSSSAHLPLSVPAENPLDKKGKNLLTLKDEQPEMYKNVLGEDLDGDDSVVVNDIDKRTEEISPTVNIGQSTGTERETPPINQEPSCELPLVTPNIEASLDNEVKVCDICGDPGYEAMLAVCSECSEGAEHVYCIQNLLGQVPEGFWQCEGCRMKQRVNGSGQTEIRAVIGPLARLPSLNVNRKPSIFGDARSRLSARLEKRKLGPEKRRALKGIPSSQFPVKRLAADNIEDPPITKKQAVENLNLPVQAINTPAVTPGLPKEGSFKTSDVGKVKLVSHTTSPIDGRGAQCIGARSSMGGKLALPGGISSAHCPYTNISRSKEVLKSRFTTLNNFTGESPGKADAAKAVPYAQATNSSAGMLSTVSPGLKSLGSLKTGDALPSFLLSSKSSFSSKLQTSSKSTKEAREVVVQGAANEALGARALRTPSKLNSFKGSKAIGASNLEQKSRLNINLGLSRSLSSKAMCSNPGPLKAVEHNHALPSDGTPEHRTNAFAASEALLSVNAGKLGDSVAPSQGESHLDYLIAHGSSSVPIAKELPSKSVAVLAGTELHGNHEFKGNEKNSSDTKTIIYAKGVEKCSPEDNAKNVLQADSLKTSRSTTVNVTEKATFGTCREVLPVNAAEKQLIQMACSPSKSIHTVEETWSLHAEGDRILQPADQDGAGPPKGATLNIDSGATTSQGVLEATTSVNSRSSAAENTTVCKLTGTDRKAAVKFGMPQPQKANLIEGEAQGRDEQAKSSSVFALLPMSELTDMGLKTKAANSMHANAERCIPGTMQQSSSILSNAHREVPFIAHESPLAKPEYSVGKVGASLFMCNMPDTVGSKDIPSQKGTDADRCSAFTGSVAFSAAAQLPMPPTVLQTPTFPVTFMTKNTAHMSTTAGPQMNISTNTASPLAPQSDISSQVHPESMNVWRCVSLFPTRVLFDICCVGALCYSENSHLTIVN